MMRELAQLYDTNYSEWAKENSRLLKEGCFIDLDIPHLLEELSDIGKAETNELESRLIILLAHLLKWQFQYQQLSERWQEFKGDSWRTTIIEQRLRLQRRLRKSPGLKSKLPAIINNAYEDAVLLAAKETRLAKEIFPEHCCYSVAEILDDDFYPVN
ncbi:DUF29 domain-containing protein [Candidatus Marithrix sp. Canyon 246]|uniref:DUF29 domain-containing protein n=2 Tax=Candidatus Marithrix sp. Canyon 246 TaxID=1827136 RepID=UPI001C0D470B|nr:DUF29 domain-containing protein [Candidatus Marithrix sp. Canyon 246]